MKRSAIKPRSRVCARICASAALVLVSACPAAGSSIQYLITVDTSSVNHNSGFVDFQFNPGDNNLQLAFATISNFNAGGGVLVIDPTPFPDPNTNPPHFTSPQLTGDVSGDLLTGPLAFTNGTALNDFFQQFTYGSFFSFVLSLTGPALDTPNGSGLGSTFGMELLDQNKAAILTDQQLFAATVQVNPNGTTTATAFLTATGDPSVVSFEVVPEPGTMLLFGFGAAGLFMLRKIRR
jgi:hypothetical protein